MHHHIRFSNKIVNILPLLLLSFIGHAQNGIDFTYTFEKHPWAENMIVVKAEITNNAARDLYFLSETCNGFDAYLKTNTINASVYSEIACEFSAPMKVEIQSNSTHAFTTAILLKDSVESLSLNLSLVALTESSEVEGKSFGDFRSNDSFTKVKLKGPEIKI